MEAFKEINMITREFFIANSDGFGFDSFDEKPVSDISSDDTGTGRHMTGSMPQRYSTDDIAKLTGFRPSPGSVYKVKITIVEELPK